MSNNTSSQLGLGSMMFLVFLVLKLTKVINWSWWWVTAPIWIPVAIAIAVLLVGIVVIISKND